MGRWMSGMVVGCWWRLVEVVDCKDGRRDGKRGRDLGFGLDVVERMVVFATTSSAWMIVLRAARRTRSRLGVSMRSSLIGLAEFVFLIGTL